MFNFEDGWWLYCGVCWLFGWLLVVRFFLFGLFGIVAIWLICLIYVDVCGVVFGGLFCRFCLF